MTDRQITKFHKDEKGSFTIEATMIFPILLILVLLFIFFSLVIYEKVALQYKANQVVSKLAYAWGSSTSDIHTGKMEGGDYVTQNGDGIYWRLFGNNASGKFGFNLGDNNLVTIKKERVGQYSAYVDFDNGPFVQEITIELTKDLSLPSFISNIFKIEDDQISATASHPVLEPAEVIRTTDFMIYGFKKFQQYAGEYLPFFAE